MLAVQFITVMSINLKKCCYTINEATERHSMTYEEMYIFLADKVKGNNILINTLLELLSHHEKFVVDVENGKVYTLDMLEEEKTKALTERKHKLVMKDMMPTPPESEETKISLRLEDIQRIQKGMLKKAMAGKERP